MNLFLKLSHSEFLFLLPECIIFNSNTCSSVLPATGSYLPELTGYSMLWEPSTCIVYHIVYNSTLIKWYLFSVYQRRKSYNVLSLKNLYDSETSDCTYR